MSSRWHFSKKLSMQKKISKRSSPILLRVNYRTHVNQTRIWFLPFLENSQRARASLELQMLDASTDSRIQDSNYHCHHSAVRQHKSLTAPGSSQNHILYLFSSLKCPGLLMGGPTVADKKYVHLEVAVVVKFLASLSYFDHKRNPSVDRTASGG